MKTLNLNKLSLLIGLFLISIAFSSGAQANNCVKDANGVIESADGASDNQVKATNGERTAFTDACTDTPDEYKLTFYKLGL